MPKTRDMAERFWEKVDRSGGPSACWPWMGCLDRGYGSFTIHQGRRRGAHQVAFALTFGAQPDGLQLDHTCHNESDCVGGIKCGHRKCVNPAHLELVTIRTNVLRSPFTITGANARKDRCHAGHPFTAANTYVARGCVRHCRTCARLRKGRPVLADLLVGPLVPSVRGAA